MLWPLWVITHHVLSFMDYGVEYSQLPTGGNEKGGRGETLSRKPFNIDDAHRALGAGSELQVRPVYSPRQLYQNIAAAGLHLNKGHIQCWVQV